MSTHPTVGPKRPVNPTDGRIGQLISGRYRITALLGEGGMGAVYLAEHTLMRKRVAVKLLHPDMAANEEMLARFRREAEAAAHIEHPHVASATDFGQTEDGGFFLVLEYVEGTSLRRALAQAPFPPARALRIARQIALALDRAHELGIVHRDLKPENVMLVRKEEDPDYVKVLDFGVARFEPRGGRDEAQQALTRLGTIMGTPEYMAPEQALGERVTGAADLYAVGVMLYEMLVGRRPFDGEIGTVMSMHIVAPVPPMTGANVPPAVEAVVMRLLEKDAKARYASGRALVEAIDEAAAASNIDLPNGISSRDRVSVAVAPRSAQHAATAQEVLANTMVGAPGIGASVGPASNPAMLASTPAVPASVPGMPASVPGMPASVPGMPASVPGMPASVPGMPASAPTVAERGPARARGGGVAASFRAAAESVAKGPRARAIIDVVTAHLARLEAVLRGPRGWLVVVAAVVPLFLVFVVTVVLIVKKPSDGSAGKGLVGGTAAKTVATASQDELRAAMLKGHAALEVLAEKYPGDVAVLRELAFVYDNAGRTSDALRTIRRATEASSEPLPRDLVGIVARAASKFETADDAFALLEGPLGADGVDALYDLSEDKSAPASTTARAKASLNKPAVRAKASPSTLLLIDLSSASTCERRKEILERSGEHADARALPLLQPLKSTKGCGRRGRSDCHRCLRGDDTLDRAIRAAEAHGAR